MSYHGYTLQLLILCNSDYDYSILLSFVLTHEELFALFVFVITCKLLNKIEIQLYNYWFIRAFIISWKMYPL